MPILTLETGWDGIRCPRCNCPRHTVVYVRHRQGVTRRVCVCDLCGRRFRTTEKTIGIVKTAFAPSKKKIGA